MANATAEPIRHGGVGDPRYPSPRRLRRWIAFALDVALHVGVGFGAFWACEQVPGLQPYAWAALPLGWIATSFVHRTVVQWLAQATLGKALLGLRIMAFDGGRAGFWFLVKWWFLGIVATAAAVVLDATPDTEEDEAKFPPVVRRCDLP